MARTVQADSGTPVLLMLPLPESDETLLRDALIKHGMIGVPWGAKFGGADVPAFLSLRWGLNTLMRSWGVARMKGYETLGWSAELWLTARDLDLLRFEFDPEIGELEYVQNL